MDRPTLNKALPNLDIIAARCHLGKGRLAAPMKANEQDNHAAGCHERQRKAPRPVQGGV